MAQTDIEWLTTFKAEIDQAKIDKAGIDGAIRQNMQRVKDEYGCASLDRAKAKLQKLKTDRDNIDTQIETAVADLKEKYV